MLILRNAIKSLKTKEKYLYKAIESKIQCNEKKKKLNICINKSIDRTALKGILFSVKY